MSTASLIQVFRETNEMAGSDPDRGATAARNFDQQGPNESQRWRWEKTQVCRTRHSDALRRQLDALVPLRQRALAWGQAASSSATISRTTIEHRLCRGASSRLIIAISHDDYVLNYGGVQTLIGDEQAACNRAGWNYLHVSPAKPLPFLADPTAAQAFHVGLRLDGKSIGVANFAELVAAVAACRHKGLTAQIICHHLMGHAPELVLDLIRASGTHRITCWIHDFFTLCPSYGLMRNDVAFCGAPDPSSPACTVCCYGEERVRHVRRMETFFEITDPNLLIPSEPARDFWLRKSTLCHADAAVVSHARLVMASSSVGAGTNSEPRALRVAHLGVGATLKGWHIFRDLALECDGDDRYAFLNLGSWVPSDLPSCIRHVPVRVTPANRYAMVEAVAEARVDVAVIWSLCFETFCYCVHEALAGGAFVITRVGAGNTWPAIERNAPRQGCALTDEEELFQLFKNRDLERIVDASNRRRGALIPSSGAANWLLNGSTTAVAAADSNEPTRAPADADG